MDEKTITIDAEQEQEAVLPEGWQEGDDLFSPEQWSGADAPQEAAPPALPPVPTTEEAAPDEVQPLRFWARLDHADHEVELDPAQLPALWQKAQVTERVQERLREQQGLVDQLDRVSRMFSYDGPQALLSDVEQTQLQRRADALVQGGMPQEMAMEMVSLLAERRAGTAPAPEPAGRNFLGELTQLLEAYPTLRGQRLPDSVLQAAVEQDRSLLSAWQQHEAAQVRQEIERLQAENRILRQNAETAARAPVRAASDAPPAGTPQSEFERSFLRGFDSGW